MMNTRRLPTAADVALGYASDARGNGIVYAAVATGGQLRTVRLTFHAEPMPGLDGREQGYAAVAAVGKYLKARGVGRARIRLGDAHVAAELNGAGSPPKALAMEYVRARCLLHGLGLARLEVAEPIEVRDLATRACAEVQLNVAA